MNWWEEYQVDVPEGASGRHTIDHFTVSKESAEKYNIGLNMIDSPAGYISPGTYTRMLRDKDTPATPPVVVMSDTPGEISDHMEFILRAKGNVLVHGLGLGVVLKALLAKEDVTHVTVVEKDSEVIELVAPHYLNITQEELGKFSTGMEIHAKGISIRCDNAYTWEPEKGQRWDCVWHDIWDFISAKNKPKMERLHRRFGQRCDFQDSWQKKFVYKEHHAVKKEEKERRAMERWMKRRFGS